MQATCVSERGGERERERERERAREGEGNQTLAELGPNIQG